MSSTPRFDMSFRNFLEMAARRSNARLAQVANDPERFAVVISAFRDNREVYPGATKDLEKDIRQRGFEIKKLPEMPTLGVTPTIGGYREGDKTVEEDSFVVSSPKGIPIPDPQKVIDFFVSLAEKYQQMGVIIKLPGEEAHEYTTSFHGEGRGNRIPYGQAQVQNKPMYYTKASKGSPDQGMTFDPQFDKIHKDPRAS